MAINPLTGLEEGNPAQFDNFRAQLEKDVAARRSERTSTQASRMETARRATQKAYEQQFSPWSGRVEELLGRKLEDFLVGGKKEIDFTKGIEQFDIGSLREARAVKPPGGSGSGYMHSEGALLGKTFADQLANQLASVTVQKQQESFVTEEDRLSEKIDTRLLANLEKESGFTSELSGLRTKAESALDEDLQRRLEGIEYVGAKERQTIGQAQSKRGLLRSTFTRSSLEESALKEQEAVGQERVGVQSKVMELRQAEKNLLDGFESQRENILAVRDAEQLKDIEGKRNMLIESELRTRMQQAMLNAQISSAKKQQLIGTLTGLATTAAMIYFMPAAAPLAVPAAAGAVSSS